MELIFYKHLYNKIIESMSNNYRDNHDFYRFGVDTDKESFSFKNYIKYKYIFPRFIPKNKTRYYVDQTTDFLGEYGERLNFLYNLLENDESKNLLIDLIAYKLLGKNRVKLHTNTAEFWKLCIESYKNADKNDYIKLNFLHWKLYKADFSKFDLALKMYILPEMIVEYQFLGHYSYNSVKKIAVEKDDIVLDCGGCYGDTAILFGNYAGNKGKVYSFEFIPSNIDIFNKNLDLNSNVSNVEIVRNPLWNQSDLKLFYSDNGPGSKVLPEAFEGMNGEVSTISIDDFVARNSIKEVNYIKMDIEGAELPALNGAISTLKTFRPKLAISIYHSMEDFVEIPAFLNSLGIGYKFYLGHYTIHAEETVLYAIV